MELQKFHSYDLMKDKVMSPSCKGSYSDKVKNTVKMYNSLIPIVLGESLLFNFVNHMIKTMCYLR